MCMMWVGWAVPQYPGVDPGNGYRYPMAGCDPHGLEAEMTVNRSKVSQDPSLPPPLLPCDKY